MNGRDESDPNIRIPAVKPDCPTPARLFPNLGRRRPARLEREFPCVPEGDFVSLAVGEGRNQARAAMVDRAPTRAPTCSAFLPERVRSCDTGTAFRAVGSGGSRAATVFLEIVIVIVIPLLFRPHAFPSPSSPAGSDVLLERYHPTHMRWGEIALVEATRVKVPSPGKKDADEPSEAIEYPHAASLTFTLRTRDEDSHAESSGAAHVHSEVSAAGSVLFAVRFDKGQRGWERFRHNLIERLAASAPEGYPEMIEKFAGNMPLGDGPEVGAFSAVVCPSMQERDADHATIVSGKLVDEPDGSRGWTTGTSSGFEDSSRTCGALREAVRYGTPSEVLTSSVSIERNVEEILSVQWVDHRSDRAVSLPKAATLSHHPAGEGEGAHESESTKDGASHYERTLSTRGEAAASPDETAFVLVADAAPARLSPGLTSGSSILGHWSIRRRILRLSPAYVVESDDRDDVDLGVFFTSARSAPIDDAFPAAIAHDLRILDHAIDAAEIRKAIRANLFAMRVEDAFLVLCSSADAGKDEAEYCAAKACAAVLNADDVCRELRAAAGN